MKALKKTRKSHNCNRVTFMFGTKRYTVQQESIDFWKDLGASHSNRYIAYLNYVYNVWRF